ncbi:4-(cytidine 5'-diphospho)-2-C-methyl-D-erythritol kinase [Celerinatantimonas diazotrophica]|uniref:4-diphosphocytidyl-2-C-methyl-D-erythritol kinase n=1 Tax=Celerinatantimonas diazotrophica TaxID=412034 RepID=A0A4R1JLX3_9GAMM|nr:4-(cytidine 5'-diphospho)-2-C-methyl-D-erythritol kinase [Celerinatantimonas diazotrophica]TCK52007.1 4-diphosphocytidyl-2-C-methyl-D-erythritol kinase [Celerinatantimonas diazotrophica]CAG9296290.1 4-diphosphocytidyl-2-C-methyl-D-erythritol kinase [Celerinatantimonas diazotrophica]
MTNPIFFPAPAKLNLFLHINGRRPDGYHELQTLFQFLDIADELSFTPTHQSEIILEPPLPGVNNSDNLIIRAANLLKPYTDKARGVKITLKKNLPMGGGIGGGSSDAATTLVVLNRLWQCGLNNQQLGQLGRKLGADVPIFIHGYAAFAQGIGEQLTPAFPAEQYYLLLTPNAMVSTAKIFNHPDLPRSTPKFPPEQYCYEKTANDCQGIVTDHYPEVAQALKWLVEYAPARMTGTGCCIFAPFTTLSAAKAVADRCPAQFHSRVCQGMNQSSLYKKLEGLGL